MNIDNQESKNQVVETEITEEKYRELLYEAIYGQPAIEIDKEIKDEVLKQVFEQVQSKTFELYQEKYNREDIYLIKQIQADNTKAEKLEKVRLDQIITRLTELRKDAIISLQVK